jgi:hypothetical protein
MEMSARRAKSALRQRVKRGEALVWRLRTYSRSRRYVKHVHASGSEARPLRIEVGCGLYPTAGYTHIDIDRSQRGVEVFAPAHATGLPSDCAEELLAVHVLEHVEPQLLDATLRHWHDLLRPGGRVEIHVPNGAALARVVEQNADHSDATIWLAQAAIFGYTITPVGAGENRGEAEPYPAAARSAENMRDGPQHRFLFTFGVLEQLLEQHGFRDVHRGRSAAECRHDTGWRDYVDDFCLEVIATKPVTAT